MEECEPTNEPTFGRVAITGVELLLGRKDVRSVAPQEMYDALCSGQLNAYVRLPLALPCELHIPPGYWSDVSNEVFRNQYVFGAGDRLAAMLPSGRALTLIWEAYLRGCLQGQVPARRPIERPTLAIDTAVQGDWFLRKRSPPRHGYSKEELRKALRAVMLERIKSFELATYDLQFEEYEVVTLFGSPELVAKAQLGRPRRFDREEINWRIAAGLVAGEISSSTTEKELELYLKERMPRSPGGRTLGMLWGAIKRNKFQ